MNDTETTETAAATGATSDTSTTTTQDAGTTTETLADTASASMLASAENLAPASSIATDHPQASGQPLAENHAFGDVARAQSQAMQTAESGVEDAWHGIQARTEALRAAITHNATAADVLKDATTYAAFILGQPTADPAPAADTAEA